MSKPAPRALEDVKLSCPYTGEGIEIIVVGEVGTPSGFLPFGGWCPGGPHKHRDLLEFMLRRRADGKNVPSTEPLVCAYTGRPIKIVKDSRGNFWARGAMEIRRLFETRRQAYYELSFRGGKPSGEVEEPKPVVIEVQTNEPPEANPAQDFQQPSALISATAEKVVAKSRGSK